VRAAIAIQPAKVSHAVAIQILAEHLTLNTENCPPKPLKYHYFHHETPGP
jgi:hypothetical protein